MFYPSWPVSYIAKPCKATLTRKKISNVCRKLGMNNASVFHCAFSGSFCTVWRLAKAEVIDVKTDVPFFYRCATSKDVVVYLYRAKKNLKESNNNNDAFICTTMVVYYDYCVSRIKGVASSRWDTCHAWLRGSGDRGGKRTLWRHVMCAVRRLLSYGFDLCRVCDSPRWESTFICSSRLSILNVLKLGPFHWIKVSLGLNAP